LRASPPGISDVWRRIVTLDMCIVLLYVALLRRGHDQEL
jgi:hypothetical protein